MPSAAPHFTPLRRVRSRHPARNVCPLFSSAHRSAASPRTGANGCAQVLWQTINRLPRLRERHRPVLVALPAGAPDLLQRMDAVIRRYHKRELEVRGAPHRACAWSALALQSSRAHYSVAHARRIILPARALCVAARALAQPAVQKAARHVCSSETRRLRRCSAKTAPLTHRCSLARYAMHARAARLQALDAFPTGQQMPDFSPEVCEASRHLNPVAGSADWLTKLTATGWTWSGVKEVCQLTTRTTPPSCAPQPCAFAATRLLPRACTHCGNLVPSILMARVAACAPLPPPHAPTAARFGLATTGRSRRRGARAFGRWSRARRT